MHLLIFILLKTQQFSTFIGRFGYIGIVIWFVTFDQLAPLPEEISLLILGYLSAKGIFYPILAGIASLIPFLIIDSIYFFLAKKGNAFIKKKLKGFASTMNPYKQKLQTNFPKTMFILCFIPRMRLFTPVLAASLKVPYKKFLLFDALTLCFFISVYLSLGYLFHESLSSVIQKTKGLQNIIFFGFTFVVAVLMIFMVLQRKKKKSKE
jgi:membrane protein DedA with SNARE-associated domain